MAARLPRLVGPANYVDCLASGHSVFFCILEEIKNARDNGPLADEDENDGAAGSPFREPPERFPHSRFVKCNNLLIDRAVDCCKIECDFHDDEPKKCPKDPSRKSEEEECFDACLDVSGAVF
ncbi:hypothetical protein WME91_30210 [Sorangium sp. So ce269]